MMQPWPQNGEHFIPLRCSDLLDLLCGDTSLALEQRGLFRRFGSLVAEWYHFEYHPLLESLKAAYAPFDPDTETVQVKLLMGGDRQERLTQLFADFEHLMKRANFIRLTREDLEKAIEGVSDWGIRMEVDFEAFERYGVFARSDTVGRRSRRRWSRFWRLEEVDLPIYRRLVFILKLCSHKRLGPLIDTNDVYLKLFKDVPQLDVEMLLPTARVRLRRLDQGKISYPLITGLVLTLYNIFSHFLAPVLNFFLGALGFALTGTPSMGIWGLASASLGYGYRSYYSYSWTKTQYSLQLTQSLYFQNLANNAGVLHHLVDEAEEQDCREVILAYYFLWRWPSPEGWCAEDLALYVATELEHRAGLHFAFEIEDALAKLEKLDLAWKADGRYHARPLPEALEILERRWRSGLQARYGSSPVEHKPADDGLRTPRTP